MSETGQAFDIKAYGGLSLKALQKCLRLDATADRELHHSHYKKDCGQAADAIDALTAELTRLQQANAALVEHGIRIRDVLTKSSLTADEKVKDALLVIAQMAEISRSALANA